MTIVGSDVKRSVAVLVHAVNLTTWKKTKKNNPIFLCEKSFFRGWKATAKTGAGLELGLALKTLGLASLLTVLNQGLGATESAVNCSEVKRTLPVVALKSKELAGVSLGH